LERRYTFREELFLGVEQVERREIDGNYCSMQPEQPNQFGVPAKFGCDSGRSRRRQSQRTRRDQPGASSVGFDPVAADRANLLLNVVGYDLPNLLTIARRLGR
jgi:hypothetical protein